MTAFVELCAGTAAVGLRAFTGRNLHPLTGYMGGKRRWATDIVGLFGHRRYDRLILVDGGPWGDVWATLQDARRRQAVAELFDQFTGWDPSDLWRMCASFPPSDDAVHRSFQYLWLQARSAGAIPVWWDGSGWVSPSGSRTGSSALVGNGGTREVGAESKAVAHQNGIERGQQRAQLAGRTEAMHERGRWHRSKSRGILRTATMARRIRDLDQVDWDRVTVVHGMVEDLEAIGDADVYFDPPYENAPRHAVLMPRHSVLDVAMQRAGYGERVMVSEATALPLSGWHALPLRDHGKPEVITANFPVTMPQQLAMPGLRP